MIGFSLSENSSKGEGVVFSFAYLILVGAVAGQYLLPSLTLLLAGQVMLFQASSDFLYDAGPSRYLKDFAFLLYSCYWPIAYQNRKSSNNLLVYYLWMSYIIFFGSLAAFSSENSELLVSGLRWVMLLHVSIGILLSCYTFGMSSKLQGIAGRTVLYLALANLIAGLWQAYLLGDVSSFGVGGARLSGLFNGSGTLAYFGLSTGILAICLEKCPVRTRFLMALTGLLLTLASGWRHAQILQLLLITYFIYEQSMLAVAFRSFGALIRIVLLPAAIAVFSLLAGVLIDRTGRGALLSSQQDSGGRAENFWAALNIYFEADVLAILFGGGLGTGTNTAQGVIERLGDDPNAFFFNIMVDNTMITSLLQLGIVGFLIFWAGIAWCFLMCRPQYGEYRARWTILIMVLAVACLAQHIFEQAIFMLTIFFAFGLNMNSGRRPE